MSQLGFFERLRSLYKIVVSSPFFISLLIVIFLTIVVLVINGRVKNKVVRLISALSYIIMIIYLLIVYGSSILKLGDNFIEKIFTLLYFPNIISYICMMIITILLILFTMINKRLSKFIRYSNIFVFILIQFLFILTLDIIVSKNIDIYSKTAVYSNQTLVVLIQSSMGVFAIWILILIIDLIANSILKFSRPNKDLESKVSSEQDLYGIGIEEDFNSFLTEESFKKSYTAKSKKDKYKKYLSYVNKSNKK